MYMERDLKRGNKVNKKLTFETVSFWDVHVPFQKYVNKIAADVWVVLMTMITGVR